MHVVIMGCGRTGSRLADQLDDAGHVVTVIDYDAAAFGRLSETFGGEVVEGNAIDRDVLLRAGIERADVFVAATSGDNRNIMASQIASEVFSVGRVVCRVKDPERGQVYQEKGILIDSRTTAGANAILEMLGATQRVG